MMTTPYKLVRSRQAARDLRAILRFLIKSHLRFGVSFADAKTRAEKRMRAVRASMNALAAFPHKGTRRDNWMPGLRSVTKDRAIFYFVVDDEARAVRVLAVFFGGQDHQRAMLRRLLSE
jgi:plasmid stabilization system protein ParE